MHIGIVRETKRHEYRVGCTPAAVKAYLSHGHTVLVESGAGQGAGFSDSEYIDAGARVEADRRRVFGESEMIVKVKEPQPDEYDLLGKGQILFTYLHLAIDRGLAKELLNRKVTGVAYETIETDDGCLPLLRPMSEIAGRLAVQEGAKYLERPVGGRGVLLGGVPGVERGRIGILGGGVVGKNAAKMALGIGAQVTVLDISADRLIYLDDIFQGRATTLHSSTEHIEKVIAESDLLIGAVLIPGAKAPKLVKHEDLRRMKPGAVIVDVAIDQGGCFETSRPTTHDEPTFVVDEIIHYCVANMPGAVSRTSTIALTTATLNSGLLIADKGLEEACAISRPLSRGVNTYDGKITYRAVAEAFDMEYVPLNSILVPSRK